MTKNALLLVAATLLAVPAGAAKAQEASWVHVRVDEADGAKVRVNVPISLVDVALDAAGEDGIAEGHLRLDGEGDLSVEEIRRMWRELRSAGDAELVEVTDGGEHVRVFRRGDHVHVRVDEEGDERVRVQLPVEVADALLGGEGNRLDVRAALRKLADRGDQELVRVREPDATVRVWIDDRSAQGS